MLKFCTSRCVKYHEAIKTVEKLYDLVIHRFETLQLGKTETNFLRQNVLKFSNVKLFSHLFSYIIEYIFILTLTLSDIFAKML